MRDRALARDRDARNHAASTLTERAANFYNFFWPGIVGSGNLGQADLTGETEGTENVFSFLPC